MRVRLLSLLVLLTGLGLCHPSMAREKQWPTKYDQYFKKYAKRYFGPNVDWRWFKAQGIAESALQDKAQSPVGAKGVMQIMPATFTEIRGKNPQFVNIDEPRWNIAAGIYYDRYLYKKITDIDSFQHRLYLTFAGYNAGYGGVLKAIKRAQQPRQQTEWQQLKRHLPKETQGYVSRIVTLKKNDLARR
jgi:membrane-bound lytic murein transglycosylase F